MSVLTRGKEGHMSRFVILALVIACCPLVEVMADETGNEGKAAPSFTLKDTSGKSHSLDQYKDKIVVLEWTEPGCPYIVRHAKAKTMTNIAKDYEKKGVGELFDYKQFKTISGVCALDIEGDPAKFEVMR